MRILRGSGRSTAVGIATLAMLAPSATAALAQSADGPDPAEASAAAAGWLAGQFADGERIDTTFDGQTYPDAGLTADAVFALAGAGVAGDVIGSATDWLGTQVATYTGDGTSEIYAGATAKLVLVAETTGRDATDFGGRDLVAQLAGLEDDTTGRFSDTSQWGDFSNALTQSLAIVALERATDAGAPEGAVDFLATAACGDGGIPEQFGTDECESAVDATGFAVQAFLAAGATDAAAAAVDWLLEQQADDGSFGGGGAIANTNSTGLAAVALAAAGEEAAAGAAAGWLAAAQYDCADVAPGAIPYAPSDAGDLTRATAQALPGLTRVGPLDTTSADTDADAPTLDCPFRFTDVDYRSPHARPITELAEAGIVRGLGDGTFAPAEGVTRAQLASFLGRAADIGPATGETDFSDVPADHTHAGYIQALADADIISGYADGTYRPSQVVRRDQAAALIARWLDLDPVDTDRFTDIAGLTHRGLINALADVEVARGTGDGSTYSPERTLQRDQVASLLHRALEVCGRRVTAVDRLSGCVRRVAVTLAVLAAATAGVALPSSDATAAESCDGVWVVVDATRLGGSVRTLCATGSPSSGLDALTRAGVAYEFVPRIPGQVCTLDGQPDPCNGAPADAYWSYWHAEAGGSWTYSQRGAGNRSPAKGTVEGWAFGAGEQPGRTPPADAPAEPEPEPSPTATAEPAPSPSSTPAPTEPTDGEDARHLQDGEAPTSDAPGPDDAPATPATQPTDADDAPAEAAEQPDEEPAVDPPTEDVEADDALDDATESSDDARVDDGVPDDEVALGDVDDGGGGGAPVGAIAGGVLVAGLAGAGAMRARRRGDLGEGRG